MQAPTTTDAFLELVRKSGLVEESKLTSFIEARRADDKPAATPKELARAFLREGLLTHYQSVQLLHGKYRGFTIGDKYKLLEHLGAGGMGSVFLCEHTAMRRRVAIKVLPLAKAKDPSYLERFYREARAVAALDHPNIVRAHDIVKDGALHFLVMEYVDGSSLQEIISQHGPMDPTRAAHYMGQAALGLQHAHEAGLVHRDIKPGNLLVDRNGTVKVLDLGLARFFHDDDGLSKKYDETVLGTSDYLAPEQTLGSDVDIRADIYSLGATFYYCLTGQTLFGEGTAAQKLIWHQTRQPKPIRALRPEVPEALAEWIETRMLAKEPAQRFQLPVEVAEALAPWTQMTIPPPPEDEMPRLSPAASRGGPTEVNPTSPSPVSRGTAASSPSRRGWVLPAGSSPRQAPTGSARPTTVQAKQAPVTQISNSNGQPPPEAPASAKGPGTGAAGAGPAAEAVQAKAPRPRPASRKSVSRRPAAGKGVALKGKGGPPVALLAVGAAAAVLLVVAAGLGVWWALSRPAQPPSPDQRPLSQAPSPRPPPAATPPAAAVADVAVTADKGTYHVRTPKYEAVVEPDGCLTSLRVGGVEFLHPGGSVSRGSYFFQEGSGALKLPSVEQPAANVLTARSDKATIRYEFAANSLTWTVTNTTRAPMPFFMVFDSWVRAVTNGAGEWARTPAVNKPWQTTTWFGGRSRLKVSGSTNLWGPFETKYQVWQAQLTPEETRTLTLEPGEATEAELAKVSAVAWERRVHNGKYDAVVEGDGCLTSLRAGDSEFLWSAGKVSRGVYLHNLSQGTQQLTTIEEPAENVVVAKNERGSLRYEFGPDTITLSAANGSNEPLNFFIVFGPAIQAVENDKGDWAKAPAERGWQTTTWFAGKAKLTITNGARIWGPWGEEPGQQLQVWDGALAPGQTRQITLKVGETTGPEAARVASLTGAQPAVETDLTVTAPLDYQVFQRYSKFRGQIVLKGKVGPACDKVEVQVTGKPLEGKLPDGWQKVTFDKANRTFDMTVPLPAGGWYKVEVRALDGQKVVGETAVDHVGIGELFVIAGQSNATNCGEEQLKPQSGLVASFSGDAWQPADDPQPGVHDRTGGGSPWPAFGDALAEKCKVPVGIASTGHSGSSVTQWQPGSEYFNWMEGRIKQLGSGGFRAVLWHQGESDVGMTAEEYAKQLGTVIQASKKEAGWDFPWFVAQVSYHDPSHTSFPTVREGQKKLWTTKVALQGPDTDTLTGDNRDGGGKGIHFSGKGLRAHGKLWAEKVGAYLDKVLAE